MNIVFKEDKDLLFVMFCSKYNKDNFNRKEFLDKYINDSEETSKLLNIFNNKITMDSLDEAVNNKEYASLYEKITKTKEYQEYLVEYKNYLDSTIKLWNQYKYRIDSYVKNVVRNDIVNNKKINIYLVNPRCNALYSEDNSAVIGKSLGEDLTSTIVNIVHEAFHILYPYDKFVLEFNNEEEYVFKTNLVHKVIECITEYDLSVMLSGSISDGRDRLMYLHDKTYSLYEDYLNTNSYSSLSSFLRSIVNKYSSVDDMELERVKLI